MLLHISSTPIKAAVHNAAVHNWQDTVLLKIAVDMILKCLALRFIT